jgi:Double zinc ribbon
MGLVDKAVNKAVTGTRTKPFPLTVGTWPAEYQGTLSALQPHEILTLATYRALLAVDLGGCTSFYSLPGQKRVSMADEVKRSSVCVVRAESLAKPGDRITCGAPSPLLHFTSDWLLQALVESAAPAIDIVASRTLDNALVNYALLKRVRQTWATALTEGPGRVTLEPGLPDLTRLVTRQLAPKRFWSPFRHDYVLPIPDSFVDGARVPLPEQGIEALPGVFAAQQLPPEGDGGDHVLASLSLSGGRPGSPPPRVTLARDERGPAIVFELPDESTHGRQRTFRAALNVLRNVARLAAETAPDASKALSDWVEAGSATLRDPERVQSFRTYWSEAVAAGIVQLRPGMPLPIGLVVRSRDASSDMGRLLTAQNWLMAFQRTWARGLTQASRDSKRIYLRKGPAVLRINGKPTPFLRFAHSGAVTAPAFTFVDGSEGWYWETSLRSRDLEDGRHETVLFASGLSRAGDMLCYGAELMRLMATFGWLIQGADPDAEIQTLTLWLDGGEGGDALAGAAANVAEPSSAIVASPSASTAAREPAAVAPESSVAQQVPAVVRCSSCDAILNQGAKFCSACGAAAPQPNRFCRGCGSQLAFESKFCSSCGQPTKH